MNYGKLIKYACFDVSKLSVDKIPEKSGLIDDRI
jgi:hypothetical protein